MFEISVSKLVAGWSKFFIRHVSTVAWHPVSEAKMWRLSLLLTHVQIVSFLIPYAGNDHTK